MTARTPDERARDPEQDEADGLSLSRRGVLASVAAGLAAAVTAADSVQQSTDDAALGGATDAQDRVPVVDLLVILGDERVSVGASEAIGPYNGTDTRGGAELAASTGAELQWSEISP